MDKIKIYREEIVRVNKIIEKEISNEYQVYKKDKWSLFEKNNLLEIINKFEITKNNKEFNYHEIHIFLILTYKLILIELNENIRPWLTIKRVNTFLKISKNYSHSDLIKSFKINEILVLIGVALKKNFKTTKHYLDSFKENKIKKKEGLVVIFYDSPISRAYLELISCLGYPISEIIRLNSNINLITRKKIPKILPINLHNKFLIYKHNIQMNYWPRYFYKNYKSIIENLFDLISEKLYFEKSLMLESIRNNKISNYASRINEVFIDNLQDEKLINVLKHYRNDSIFLFTGGGIFPSKILENKRKIIHIHPGFLPKIKGSDGFFWSNIIFNQPSVSSFYLEPKLDSGKILNRFLLPKIEINFLNEFFSINEIYRIIYSYVDPWIRCYALRELLNNGIPYKTDSLIPQEGNNDENTFYFMDPLVKSFLLNNFNLNYDKPK